MQLHILALQRKDSMTDMPTFKRAIAQLTRLFTYLIGNWQWNAPPWLKSIRHRTALAWNYFAADVKRAGVPLLVAVTLAAGFLWYISLPQPHYVTFGVTTPQLTEYNERGISRIYPLRVVFSEP